MPLPLPLICTCRELMSFKNFDPHVIPLIKLQLPTGITHRNEPKLAPATPTNVWTRPVSGGPSCSFVSAQIPPINAQNLLFSTITKQQNSYFSGNRRSHRIGNYIHFRGRVGGNGLHNHPDLKFLATSVQKFGIIACIRFFKSTNLNCLFLVKQHTFGWHKIADQKLANQQSTTSLVSINSNGPAQ